jgi:hypothetical protein
MAIVIHKEPSPVPNSRCLWCRKKIPQGTERVRVETINSNGRNSKAAIFCSVDHQQEKEAENLNRIKV